MKNKILISVVISTYNRSIFLKKAINSLIEQSFDKSLYEIIVVNNCSTDDTDVVVKSFQREIRLPTIRLVDEKRQGLGFGRNRGIRLAKGKYVAFFDDDAVIDKDWLACAFKYFVKIIRPEPFAIGGPVYPRYYTQKPVWFKDDYETDLLDRKERWLNFKEAFSGGNVIFQKKIISEYDGFNTEIGVKGDSLSVGEETYLFEKIWKKNKGKKNLFYFSPKLKIYHYIHPYKLTVCYRLKRSFSTGQSYYLRTKSNNILVDFITMCKVIGYLFISSLLIFVPTDKSLKFKRWIVERVAPFFWIFGFLASFFGWRLKIRQG